MKAKAKGDAMIPPEERLYLTVRFTAIDQTVHIFCKRKSPLGDCLNDISHRHTLLAYGTPVIPEGLSLVITAEEFPNWDDEHWNRRSI